MLQPGEGGPCYWLAAAHGSTGRSRCQGLDDVWGKPREPWLFLISQKFRRLYAHILLASDLSLSLEIQSPYLHGFDRNRHPRLPASGLKKWVQSSMESSQRKVNSFCFMTMPSVESPLFSEDSNPVVATFGGFFWQWFQLKPSFLCA